MNTLPAKSDFIPGEIAPVTALFTELRPVFIPWICERYGVSDYYGEDIMVDTAIAFRDYVDQGRLKEEDTDPAAVFYGMGAEIGARYLSWIYVDSPTQSHASSAQVQAADQKFGIQLTRVPFTFQLGTDKKSKIEEAVIAVIPKLNPQSQSLLKIFSRTSLSRAEVALAADLKTEKGLRFEEERFMERLYQDLITHSGMDLAVLNNRELQIQLDRYVRGEMEGAELKAFNARLHSEPVLQGHLGIYKEVLSGFQRIYRDEMTMEFSELSAALFQAGRDEITKGMLLKIGMAVGIATGIALICFLPALLN